MTHKKAKEMGFTHEGLMYGFIKVYGADTDQIEPIISEKNWLYGILLDIFTFVDINFGNPERGFEMQFITIEEAEMIDEQKGIDWAMWVFFLMLAWVFVKYVFKIV